ncbi:AAA family ATPase [Streptosporangium sp. KLBMP 9127]|nr:AAA family ATPase [Streptosporangium sp. KLBMP 9127]
MPHAETSEAEASKPSKPAKPSKSGDSAEADPEPESTSRTQERGLFEPATERGEPERAQESPGAAPSSFGGDPAPPKAGDSTSDTVFTLRLPTEETPAAPGESHDWGSPPAEPAKASGWATTPAEPVPAPDWAHTPAEPVKAPDRGDTPAQPEWESAQGEPTWKSSRSEPDWKSKPAEPDWKSKPAEPDWKSKPAEPDWKSESAEPDWKSESAEPGWKGGQAEPDWKSSRSEPDWKSRPAEPDWKSGQGEPDWKSKPAEPDWKSEPTGSRSAVPEWGNTPAEPVKAPDWPGSQSDWGNTAPDQQRPVRETSRAKPAEAPAREPYQARRRQTQAQAFSAPARQAGKPTADSLDPESLLRGRRNAPSSGWRKLIYKASAGWIKPGEPPEVRRRRVLIGRARTPVATGHHRVAVLSLKGGVGKTTTTVGLGATLAQVRGDRVIAVDANPDRGTLSDKVELETSATVRDLLNERGQIKRYVDIRAFTSQAPSRLEILASDRDPSVSEAFSAADYQAVSQVLENFYSICITDCGTGLLHSAMSGVLGLADQLVLVSSPSVDGARAASATLDWLEAHHYGELVRSATVVLCSVRPRSKSTVDLDKLEAHFAARCRAVIRVPYDPHLEEGAEIDLERLQESTRDSYLRLAASVGDGFAPLVNAGL